MKLRRTENGANFLGHHLHREPQTNNEATTLQITRVLTYRSGPFYVVSCHQTLKAKFHYASWFEAGHRQVRRCSATSFEPASNQLA